jgi:sugar phosphate isomerase/epimerase
LFFATIGLHTILSRTNKAFHVKDAEFNPTGKQGTFEDIQSWANRAGRYRSPGDGQVDLKPFSVN